MSLWHCETHGLTGPMACCAKAGRATLTPTPGTIGTTRPAVITTTASWPWLRALADANYDGDGMHYFTKIHAAQLRALLAHVDGGTPDA